MSDELPEHIQLSLDMIAAERERHQRAAGPARRLIARATRTAARPAVQLLLVLAAAGWIAFNLLAPLAGSRPFDPPPFDALADVATGLALITTLLILTTQQHENELVERRADLTLQLAMLQERRSAKLLRLLDELRRDLPQVEHRRDPETEALAEAADPVVVLDVIRKIAVSEPADAAALPGAPRAP